MSCYINTFCIRIALFHRNTMQPANPYLEHQLQLKALQNKVLKLIQHTFIKKRSEFESTYFVCLIIDFRK